MESARYLGVINKNLNQKKHVNNISHKVIQDNAILLKIRNYVKKGTLRTVYFAIFHSCINHVPIALGNTTHNREYLFSNRKL